MHRLVRRSSIVAVALATTLGASAALADTTGISPEALKSALSARQGASSSFANILKSSAFSDAQRFYRYDLASADESEFSALKLAGATGGRVGILAPEHNGDIQFAQAGVLTPQHNGDIQFAQQAGILAPQHNGDIQFAQQAAALAPMHNGDIQFADRQADAAFGDTASECAAAPVKLADVGAAMRSFSGAPAVAGDESAFAQAFRLESPASLANFKKFAASGELQGSPGFAALVKTLIRDSSSTALFSDVQVSDIAAIKMALNGQNEAAGSLNDVVTGSQLASALQKR